MIAVWFSCGAASAVAAKLTVEKYGGEHEIRIVNNPVINEDSDNRRFADDVSAWLGLPIESAINAKFPACDCVEVWAKKRFMAGVHGAPCTQALKKEARQQWEVRNNPDWHVLGFTADEVRRHERFTLTERTNVLPVLIDAGMTKADCFKVLADVGIDLPAIYRRGYPNARLTESQVMEILKSQGTHREIAKRFHVTEQAVGRIRNRKQWRHVA